MIAGGATASAALDRRRRWIGIAISALLVLVAGLLAAQGGGSGSDTAAIDTSPHVVEAGDLAALEDSLGHALYWAGERPSGQLELTEEVDGSVYLRYLPPGVEAGDPRPDFLTVGTYPVAAADAALRRTAADSGSNLGRTGDGGLTLVNPSSQGSAYLAYPGSDLQIEVYDPAPGRALRLIRSGAIRPVG